MRVWDLKTLDALLVVEQAHTAAIFSIQSLTPSILMTGGRDRVVLKILKISLVNSREG